MNRASIFKPWTVTKEDYCGCINIGIKRGMSVEVLYVGGPTTEQKSSLELVSVVLAKQSLQV